MEKGKQSNARNGLSPTSYNQQIGAAAWHLHTDYVPALLAGDKSKRSIELGKMKNLLFLVLVVGMVFKLLSMDSHIAFRKSGQGKASPHANRNLLFNPSACLLPDNTTDGSIKMDNPLYALPLKLKAWN